MREVVFAVELRGKAGAVQGKEGNFKAVTSGRDPRGGRVNFESDVVVTGETFDEKGTIDYAGHGKVRFETVGAGYMTAMPVSGLLWGAVMWKVIGGDGEYRGTSGFITSNFTFSTEDGEVVDNQYVRLAVP